MFFSFSQKTKDTCVGGQSPIAARSSLDCTAYIAALRMEGRREAEQLCASVTQVMHTLSNEPSVGLYYVMEHIQRSVPALVADKAQHVQVAEAFGGAGLDAKFALEDMRAATSGGTMRALENVAKLAESSRQKLAGVEATAAVQRDRVS